jgi:hypothetical protein
LPWFVCKKLELNTKSPTGFYVRTSAFNGVRIGCDSVVA